MKARVTTIRFLLVLTMIVAVAAMLIGYLVSAAKGNQSAIPPLIFGAMIAPLALMAIVFILLRLVRKIR